MTYSKDEILQALKVLQDVCITHSCEECPFAAADGERCVINDGNPSEWVFTEPEQVWRAVRIE